LGRHKKYAITHPSSEKGSEKQTTSDVVARFVYENVSQTIMIVNVDELKLKHLHMKAEERGFPSDSDSVQSVGNSIIL
jgi:hypothetical protein